MVQRLFSLVRSPDQPRTTTVSNALFAAGLVLTVVIMPLDRVHDLATRPPYLSLLALLLLVQRGLVLAWDRFRDRTLRPPRARLAAAFFLPAIAAGVAALVGYDKKVAFAAAVLFGFVLLRGWALAQYVRKSDLALFERVLLWMVVLVIAFGYYQYLGDVFGLPSSWTLLQGDYSSIATYPFPRDQSFALEPLYLAHYLFLPIGVLLVRFVRKERTSRSERLLLIFTLALFLLTLSRGAIIGFVLSAALLLIVARSRRLLGYLAKTLGYALAIVLAMLVLTGVVHWASGSKGTGTVSAFTSHAVDLNDASAQTRYDLWQPALSVFIHHPVAGVGPNNSRLLVHGVPGTASTAEADKLQPVNNDYLEYLSEMGLVGVVLTLPLAAFVLRALWGVIRARFDHPSGPYAFAIVGMAFEANAFHSLLLLRTWVIIALLVAGARLASEKREDQRSNLQLGPYEVGSIDDASATVNGRETAAHSDEAAVLTTAP